MQVGSVVVYAARRAHRGCAPPASPRPAPTAGRRPSMAGCPHTPCARDGLWPWSALGKIDGNSNRNRSANVRSKAHNDPGGSRSQTEGRVRTGRTRSGRSGVFPDRGDGGARCGRRGDAQSRPWMAGGRKWEQDSADSGWASPLRPRRAAVAQKTPTRTSPRLGEEAEKGAPANGRPCPHPGADRLDPGQNSVEMLNEYDTPGSYRSTWIF